VSQPPDPAEHAAAVRAWAAHLAAGGTSPWREWRTGTDRTDRTATDRTATGVVAPTPTLPGAAQLEAVRRLALRRPAAYDRERFARIAARVLATPGPGRGLPHLPVLPLDPTTGEPLPPVSAIGARPVDPARVPVEELLRVLTGVLPALLATAAPHVRRPEPEVRATPGRRTARPVRFRVVGPPAASETVRAALLAAGHHEGGPGERVVVLGLPVEAMLAEAWGIRVSRGSATRWHRFVAQWTEQQLLVSMNLPALARHHLTPAPAGLRSRLRGLFGGAPAAPAPVVVLAETVEDLLPRVADALGLPDLAPAPTAPRGLDAEAADLLRRVHRIAGISLPPARGEDATAAALALLTRPGARPRVGAPASFRPRIEQLAARLADQLTDDAAAGRYAVAGDPAVLGIRPRVGSAAPDLGVVLERGVDLVLAAVAATPEERS